MVWEIPYYPTYYLPVKDVRTDLLHNTGETTRSPSRGTAEVHDITAGNTTRPASAFVWNDVAIDEISEHVSFDWGSMDAWFEEDDEVFVHARDPYTRVDILQSSRNIRIEVDGVTVAESDRARILFETGLPARYYLPKTDVHFEYLAPSDLETRCPYKGTARYWSVTTQGTRHDNVVWGYDAPLKESMDIGGFVSFYNEKLDIYIDGELEDRPKTKFG